MFERRLKIILFILAMVVFVLIGRAAQEQIFFRDYWQNEAKGATSRPGTIETLRGTIKDRAGRVLAIDQPCVDACVEYPALTHPPQPEWLKAKAAERLRSRLGDAYSHLKKRERVQMVETESKAVEADVEAMWAKLAQVSGKSADEIQEIREAIIRKVQMRQKSVWQKRVADALKKQGGKGGDNLLKRFLSNPDDDPTGDSLKVVVTDQLEAHIVLRAIESPVQNELGKNLEHYPGLVLRAGTHRVYPYADVACHVLGNLGRVNAEDLLLYPQDDLHKYMPNDLIGKSGIEWLAEPALRGARGRVDRTLVGETILSQQDAIPGQDIRLTIDIELQQQIQSVFSNATVRDQFGTPTEEGVTFHGAAVVLKVDTNEVLAMVSYPTFDVNRLDELYSRLKDDDMNKPLTNRATQAQREPGSTVKPLCGLAGITEGVVGVNQGIECKGYLDLDNHPWGIGRCWVANSSFTPDLLKPNGLGVAHHKVPTQDPHVGHDGNLDGFLTYSDGLERSCNVYFETVADWLGIDRLSNWYSRFGLGRVTGIGLPEAKGQLPNSSPLKAANRRAIGFFGGIGQGYVTATPIQMANATAMIARNGILMRPILIIPNSEGMPPLKVNPSPDTPDREDLHLPPEALAAARDGMSRVVNKFAGAGKALVAGDKLLQSAMVCGKTGTAQIGSKFWVPVRDESGNEVHEANGSVKRFYPVPSTKNNVNPQAPWYREQDGKIDHSWFVGFAPRDNPKIVFAVMIEYGGSGGGAAASVAREALEACISRGYLPVPTAGGPTTQPAGE